MYTQLAAFELRAEFQGLSGGSVARPGNAGTIDIAKRLADGDGQIQTEDPVEIEVFKTQPALVEAKQPRNSAPKRAEQQSSPAAKVGG